MNFMDFQAVRYLNEGEVPVSTGNDHPTLVPMGAYKTSDGMVNIAVMSGFDRFCSVVGAADVLEDPRFMDQRSRTLNRDALAAEVGRLLQRDTTAHWVEVLNAADFPCGPVLSIDEMFADPQIAHLDLVVDVPHPTDREEIVQVLRHPVTFSSTPAGVRGGPPRRGAHMSEILSELGMSSDEIAAFGTVSESPE